MNNRYTADQSRAAWYVFVYFFWSSPHLLLEAIVIHDPHVQSAIMFGRGRLQTGILIEPRKECSVDVNDLHALENFKNTIWCVFRVASS